MKEKRVTIKDIAQKSSVSETTISRYINGKYEYMSEDTRKRIAKVISELNYRPSYIARSLKSNKSNILGAVIADIENPFSNLIIKGLIDRANEYGYSLMISISNNSIKKENEGIRNFLDHGVDGLIVNTVTGSGKTLEEFNKKIPLVLIDRNIDGFEADFVTSNNYELGCELINHLVESGFKSLGFFSEVIKDNSVRKLRYSAFFDSLRNRSDLNHNAYIVEREKTEENKDLLNKFIKMPEPRVIIAGNGLLQLDLLRLMKENNYKLGIDFHVSGFDDYIWSAMIGEDGITSTSQDSYKLAANAVDILIGRIEGKFNSDGRPITRIIEGELRTRGSTRIT